MAGLTWKGKVIGTLGDLLDAVAGCTTREEAQEFMSLYRADNSFADANIGYLGGYCDPETRRRIEDWCEVAHPIFGKSRPTPEEAFARGVLRAETVGLPIEGRDERD